MNIAFDEYELDTVRLELKRAGVPVRADRMVLRLLGALVRDAGELVTKDELIARVWERRAVSQNVITVSVARLRKTLGQQPGEREFVVSVQGRGYRFVRPVRSVARGGGPSGESTSGAAQAGRAPLVGREPMLRQLRAALDAAETGHGGVCVLTGEPGIGKTALAEQLGGEAERRGLKVVWSYCQEVGETPPLWPFAQLVRALRGRADDATLAPELRWLLRAGSSDVRPVARHHLFEAVLDALEDAATPTGCVLVVDDLHRADAASLELLRYWMGRIARTRVLVVATSRTGGSAHALGGVDLRFVLGHRNCTRLALGRLTEDVVRAYVATALPDADGALGRAVWTASEGSPFFMVELARQLATRDSDDAPSLHVSAHALEPWRARILELDAAVRDVLSHAAVIGRRFELRLLAQITGEPVAAVVSCLDHAVASEAVIRAAEADTAFAFTHELICKLLYDDLTPTARRALHRKVGETLEARAHAGEVVPPAALAYHFHAALPDADPAATLLHCQRAAVEATYAFAHTDSLLYLQRAREALSLYPQPNPAARWLLLLHSAVAARIVGAAEFESLVREAADVARGMGAGGLLIEAAMLMHVHPGFPLPARARALLDEGLALLPPDETTQRAAALARLATCGPTSFDAARSHAQMREALALLGDSPAAIAAYNTHSAALYLGGGPSSDDLAARSAGAIDAITRTRPEVLRIAPIQLDLHGAIVALQAGDVDACHARLDRAARRCEATGARELRWYVDRAQLLVRFDQERPDDIAEGLRALHAQARRAPFVGAALLSTFDQVVVLGEVVAPARLRELLAHSRDDAPGIWSLKLHALAVAGLHDDAARALFAVTPEQLARLPHDRDYLGTLGALAGAAIRLGARAHAEALDALLAPHEARLAVHVSFVCLGPVARLRGELARALHRPADALTHFHAALRTAERLRLRAHGEAARAAIAELG
ncbi:MAG: AAA family ATPase, partial [Polyangiales bacterium]